MLLPQANKYNNNTCMLVFIRMPQNLILVIQEEKLSHEAYFCSAKKNRLRVAFKLEM